ncbi:MAG: aminotransferase class I/II-fold pyridoxal phosphate-dependent enzyme [Bryobacterales bacterium]|nr:aminotransferase class I/II-fold pyridoxal phosphate-dependent enzyme [Bryobacterales bacterium]
MRESVIRQMTILARETGGVNLAQGFSDEDAAPEIKALAMEAIQGEYHQYTDVRGAPYLRQALAEKLRKHNAIVADPDKEIVVTCGATEGMMIAFETLLEPGDTVLTFAPMYENYVLQSVPTRVRVKSIELDESSSEGREPFTFSRETLETAYVEGTQAILFSNPWNPIGKVFTREELQTIVDFAVAHDLFIFADETYEYLLGPGREHVSVASLPGAEGRTITVISMGKTYSITGWRVAYLVAPEEFAAKLNVMHDFHTVTAPHPFQIAAANATRLPESFYQRVRDEYWARKQILCDALAEAGFTWYEPGGAYFLWCRYDRLSDLDDMAFGRKLLLEGGVAGVPGSVFYEPGKPRYAIRFTYSKSRKTLEAAAERLRRLRWRSAAAGSEAS